MSPGVARATRTLACAALLLSGCADGGPTEPGPPIGPEDAARVQAGVERIDFSALGDTARVAAQAFDSAGEPLDLDVEWTVLDTAVATVDEDGSIESRGNGLTRVVARVGAHADSVLVHVSQQVASVELERDSLELTIGGSGVVHVHALDANGHPVAGVSYEWSLTEPGVVTIAAFQGQEGYRAALIASAPGAVTVRATALPSGFHDELRVDVAGHAVDFATVSAGGYQACGLDHGGAAYCWGGLYIGEFPVLGGFGSNVFHAPVAIGGDIVFDAVEAGHSRSCGLAAGTAWCWGTDNDGSMGNGDFESSATPVAVAGGHEFASISVGQFHACGLTAEGAAWCWGSNIHAQIGDGTLTDRPAPVAVAGDHRFASIVAAAYHTCGIDLDGTAWCWGLNTDGQLGTHAGDIDCSDAVGPGLCAPFPTAVESGALAFELIQPGGYHTCGLDADGAAWCWGQNDLGTLGTGIEGGSVEPQRVAGGHVFTTLTTAMTVTCGLVADGSAWCWGLNDNGQVGTTDALDCYTSWFTIEPCVPTPTPVGGGLAFETLDSGTYFVCGRTYGGQPHCWGDNVEGTLGSGAPDPVYSALPLRVWGAE